MGAVGIDIHKDEYEYMPFSLSDENVIKYLILHRNKLDSGYSSIINYDIYQAGDTFDFNVELISLYSDLDKLIKECAFEENEKKLLTLLFDGNWLSDIPKIDEDFCKTTSNLDNAQRNLRRILDRIVYKIKEKNNKKWKKYIKRQKNDNF